MKNYFIVILSQFLFSCELLAQTSRTMAGYSVTEIEPTGSGYESYLEHQQSVAERFLLGARADSQHRFGLTDEALQLSAGYRRKGHHTLILAAGGSRSGELLPKTNIYSEFSKEFSDWSLSVSYNYRHYSDLQAQILALGPDISLWSESLLILRAYGSHTNFDQTEKSSSALAVMAKFVQNFNQSHSWSFFYSRGKEGTLRSFPPQNQLVEVQSLGTLFRLRISNTLYVVPEISLTQYPDLDMEFRRYGLVLEVNW